jgi:hypothetical protein
MQLRLFIINRLTLLIDLSRKIFHPPRHMVVDHQSTVLRLDVDDQTNPYYIRLMARFRSESAGYM